MLPILKATAFVAYNLAGGSTQPCIVSVTDEDGNYLDDTYVIKIFPDDKLEHTYKEVCAAILAQHFSLNIPEPVLIAVNKPLLNELKKQTQYKNWHVTEGVFFASKYMKGVDSFTNALNLNQYDKWQMGNIFAFDVLIMNVDRQVNKPNIIVKNQDIYVIDHELSMSISNSFEGYIERKAWDYFIKENRGGHLFRHHLSTIGNKEVVTFDEFIENLRMLHPNILLKYVEQLTEYQYEPFGIPELIAYLSEVKSKETQFLELLHQLLY
jgi:hypothetical protein